MEDEAAVTALAAPLICLSTLLPCGFIGVFMVFYVLMFAVMIVGLILWVIMLIDVIQRQDDQFPTQSKDRKLLWLLIVILGGWIGALVYYFIVYKKMGAAKKA